MSTVRDQAAIRHTGSNSRGFSLVEILVVVMVILIIAAIAIPNLVQSKMRANEAAAVASVKNINTAETLFLNSYPEVGYSSNLANLGSNGSSCDKPTRTNSCIIMDDALTSGLKSGYIFELLNDGKTPSRAYTIKSTLCCVRYREEEVVSGR